MKARTKITRSVKAVSKVISVLLMIAIAVAAALIAYAWIMGYMGGTTTKTQKAIQIQSIAADNDDNLVVYVQNVGIGTVRLNPDSVYVNDVLQDINNIDGHALSPIDTVPVVDGQTVTITVLFTVPFDKPIKVKVVTSEGVFIEYTGTIKSKGGGTPPANVPPTAAFTFSPPNPATGDTVTFTDASTDSDGTVVAWSWTFGDLGASSERNPTHSYSSANTYAVRLTVTDDDGATNYVERSVTVTATPPANVAPTAAFSFLPTDPETGETVTFTDASSDSDGSVVAWLWTFGDGGASSVRNPTYSYSSANTYTVRLTVTDDDGATNYVEHTVPVTAAFDHFTITGYPSSATVGQSFGGVTVTAYDAANNVVTGYTGQVYFTSTDGAAVLPYTSGSRYTFTSGAGMDNGVHTFLGFTLNTAGSRTITVTDGTKYATTTAITVTNPSGNINYNTAISPTSATQGSSVTFTYTITRELSYDNLGWASIQVPAGFTITGTPTVTDSNPPGGTWVATVAGNTITVHASGTSSELTTNGQYVRVTFTANVPATAGTYGPFTSTVYEHYDKSGSGPGTLDGNDPTVTVYVAGVLDHFTITGSYPTSVNAGASFGNLIVTAYDGGNNVLTGYTGQVYFTSTDSGATLPFTVASKYPFTSGDNGVHAFSGFALTTIGSQRITVTDGSKSATTSSITVTPGSLHHFTITGAPVSTTSGTSFGGIQVTAYDAYNNVATNYRGQVYFQSTDGTATLPYTSSSRYTFVSVDAGVHQFSGFTLRTIGSQTITVTDGSISATTPTITVTAPLHHFTITGYPTTVTQNQLFGGVVVTAYDAGNNVLTTYTGQVYFTATGGSATLPYTSSSRYTFVSVDAGVHIFSGFEFGSTGSKTITVTDGTNSATTNTITVVATGSLHYATSMTPTTSQTGSSVSYTYTITRDSSGSSIHLGWVNIQVPAGFTSISVTSVTASNGQTWVSSVSGNVITVHAQAAAGELSGTSSGQTVTVVFSATAPTTTGTYGPLVSTAYQTYTGPAGSPSSPGQLDGSDPTITVFAAGTKLVYIAGAGQSVAMNAVSSVITVQLQDATGHPITAGGAITVILTTTATTSGSFYNNAGGTGSAITQIAIASGSSSANFYYKDTAAGSPTITAQSAGLTSATTTFTITLNLVSNGGFESASGGWTTSTQGGGVECHIQSQDDIPPHSGSNFAEIDTTELTSDTTAYSRLTQTFSPAIPINSIPNTAGSLSIWVYNNGYRSSNGYYSFQITLTASDGSQLIYYWGNSPATPPTQTATVKVINMGNLPGTFTVGQWVQFSANLYNDWTTNGLSISTSIATLAIQCNGYRQSSSQQYGQEIFLDDVQIQ